MNDSKDFPDAESIRSGNSHVTNRPVFFPSHPVPRRVLSCSSGVLTQRRAAMHLGHAWYFGKRCFANPDASCSALYPKVLNQRSSSIEEPLHSSTVEKSERRTQNQDQRCQSGPSTKNSVIFSGRDSPKNYGAHQQRLQDFGSSFCQIPYTSHVCMLEDKIQDRGMYLFTISYGSFATDQKSGDG